MTTEEAVRIKKKGFIYAKSIGFETSECECLAHQVLLRFLEDESSHQSVEQAIIDEVRRRFGGKKGSEHRLGTQWWAKHAVSLEDLLIVPGQRYSTNELDLSVLASIENAVLTLYSKWGLTKTEIAECFGKGDVWVNWVMRTSIKKLRKLE